MSRMHQLAALCAILLGPAALLSGCGGKGADAASQPAVQAPEPTAVEVAPAQVADVQETLDLVGAIKAKFEATVRSEYTGTLSDVYITEWVTVKKGDALARLDLRDTEARIAQSQAEVASARADLLSVKAQAERAQRDYERLAQLKKEEIISAQALDAASQQRDTAAAQVQAAQARMTAAEEGMRQSQIKKTKSLLVAPMDGVVANRHANVGQFVDNMGQGEPLFRIVDNRVLDVTLTVPATDLGKVRIGQDVQFVTDFLPGKAFTAKVTHINPAADPSTRSVSVVAEIENTTGELRDGLFVKARIVVGQRQGVLQIPRAALLPTAQGQGGVELFVVQGGKAVKRVVQTGRESIETVEVSAGLKAGEHVVTRGGFMLQDGDPVKVVTSPDATPSAPETGAAPREA